MSDNPNQTVIHVVVDNGIILRAFKSPDEAHGFAETYGEELGYRIDVLSVVLT
jgi:hypothetical protein